MHTLYGEHLMHFTPNCIVHSFKHAKHLLQNQSHYNSLTKIDETQTGFFFS